jgi:putative ABC transport system permease protein
MIRNYLKTALRNLWKNKGFSAINILGLAIGLATCLLILIYVMDELSYDRYNKNADRIYRLDTEIKFGGANFIHLVMAQGPAPAGQAMLRDYPEVEKEVRLQKSGGFLVRKGSQHIQENAVVYADSTIFDVFTLPLIDGDPHTALMDAHTIVLSATMARKYFDAVDVVGKTLLINDSIPYKVTGVMRDMPTQSHFHADFLVSLSESEDAKRPDAWTQNSYNTYILLRQGVDGRQFEGKLQGMIVKYIAASIQSFLNISLDQFYKSGNKYAYTLTPLTAIHLHSNKMGELGANGNPQYVYIFSTIAIFILLIACVNFMNLSTARSANRAKEVGIRKVLGSLRGSLIWQFIVESMLVSFVAMLLALGIAWLLLPVFDQLADKEMSIGLFSRPLLAPGLLCLVLVVGLLAGSYPAFFLSAFQPIAVLKGNVSSGFKTGWLRNSLVVFQFFISICLIIGTVVIYRQLGYIRSRSLGFNREQVLVIHNTPALGDGITAYKNGLATLPGVEGVTVTGYLPTSGDRNNNAFWLSPDFDFKKALAMEKWLIDEHYISVLGMSIVAGRNFSKDFPTDSTGVIINEAAARLVGLTHPIGAKFYTYDDIVTKKPLIYHVVGVVKDFNFNSLRETVSPLVFLLQPNNDRIALRVSTDHVERLVTQVEDQWRKLAPGVPFSYTFMDDDFNSLYRSEQRIGGISLSFSLLAIFIACLGLFGLAAYEAEQRTREIGIRKVLGASVTSIIALLSRNFLLLVGIAALIAFPLSWWAMHSWLQDYAYRISIGWGVFALAGALAAGIALLSVGLQAFRSALANPVKSLRAE